MTISLPRFRHVRADRGERRLVVELDLVAVAANTEFLPKRVEIGRVGRVFHARVQIREHGRVRCSVTDAEDFVDIDEVFRIGDRATHTTVLTDLYARMKDAPNAPDLDALWQKLGVRGDGDKIEFDDKAPLAAIRTDMAKAR